METSEAITSLVNIAALFFVGAQVLLARRAIRNTTAAQQDEWSRLRKQATIDASISTAQYRESLKADLPWNDRDPGEVAEFLRAAAGDPEKLAPVRQYLNHLEDVAVGVKQKVLDIDTLSMLSGSRIVDTVDNYASHIENVRKQLKRPQIYIELEELANRLRTLN
ncbi:hypothetical protein Val02_85290 [Virgisporangium aliadipatigenens]|uniref:Uncharacterized protein n=1 Tax=Virgisporangium aliadipatigenens TaxID=741659 RepID=A0A8J4DVY3_9ACTN|nr:DUF4760 domain-containing protein [Virgisporangium aliadipatigenens]GIJ51643.1 hypothetical protein Val02_85290 [Virgisporangium aliadipatigenens]